ncbi:unnamed protein product, partial [marine sediment metagenome]
STFPSRFLNKKIVAAATGFIDGMAYVGAIIVGLLVPFLIDVGGWGTVFLFWSTSCFIVIFLVMFLYLRTRTDGKAAKRLDVLTYEKKI